jgi:hypothetical protein
MLLTIERKQFKMRNIKILGLALVAMFAMSAMVAATASADDFNAESYTATLAGTKDGEDLFTTTAGTVKCTTPTYAATITAKTKTISATPSYTGCTGFGFPAEVITTGCTYVFTVNGGTSTEGKVDVECGSNEITVVAKSGATVKCTVHVKTQTDLTGTVKYTNVGVGTTREVTLEANLGGIDYTHTAGSGIGACVSGSATNGTLTGKGFVTGSKAGAHVGVFLTNA